MDGSTFDRLTRAVSTAGSRRRVLSLLTSVGLGGLLSTLDDDESVAKREHGRNRGHHPGKHKRRNKRKRKGNGGGGGGRGGPSVPVPAPPLGDRASRTVTAAVGTASTNCARPR